MSSKSSKGSKQHMFRVVLKRLEKSASLGFTLSGGRDSGRLIVVKLGPKKQRSKQVHENDVLLAVNGMSVLSAPLEMVNDMFATGDNIIADFARNVFDTSVDHYLSGGFHTDNYIESRISEELVRTSKEAGMNEKPNPEYIRVTPEAFHTLVQQDKFSHWGEFNGSFHGLFKPNASTGSSAPRPSIANVLGTQIIQFAGHPTGAAEPPKSDDPAKPEPPKYIKPKKTVHIQEKPAAIPAAVAPEDEDIVAEEEAVPEKVPEKVPENGDALSDHTDRSDFVFGRHSTVRAFVNPALHPSAVEMAISRTSGSVTSDHRDYFDRSTSPSFSDRSHLSRTLTVRGAMLLQQPVVTPSELPIIEAELKRLATLSKKGRALLRKNSLNSHEAPVMHAHILEADENRLRLEDLDRSARAQELGDMPPGWRMLHTEDGEEYYINDETLVSSWLDPRLERLAAEPDEELPHGWDRIVHPVHGVFYIDHLNQRTTRTRPRVLKRNIKGDPLATYDPLARACTRKYVYEATNYALNLPQQMDDVDAELMALLAGSGNGKSTTASLRVRSSDPALAPGHVLREIQCRIMRPATGGFGFTITGGYPQKILVHKVLENYPAHGILLPGDQIIKANHIHITPLTQEKALEAFASLPPNEEAVFTVVRDIDINAINSAQLDLPVPSPAKPPRSRKSDNLAVQAVNVIIEQIDRSLGFELSSNFPPHVVVNVKPGGHAELNGLENGDVMAFIGGTDVQRMTQEELLDFLISSTEKQSVKALVFRNAQLKEPSFVSVPCSVTIEQDVPGELGFKLGSQLTTTAIVAELDQYGLASRCGLEVGDQIVAVNSIETHAGSTEDILALIEEASIHRPAVVRIHRPIKSGQPEQGARVIDIIIEKEKNEPSIGARLSNISHGVVVAAVDPDGPANRNGLLVDDMFAYLDGLDIRNLPLDHLRNTLIEASRETPSRAIVFRKVVQREGERSTYPVGIMIEDPANFTLSQKPNAVISMDPSCPSATHGLKLGDTIVAVNNTSVLHLTPEDLMRLLEKTTESGPVTARVARYHPDKGSSSHSVLLEKDAYTNTLLFALARPAVGVSSVSPNSSAAANGLRVGDEFAFINDVDVQSKGRDDLLNELITATDTQPAMAIVLRTILPPPTGLTPNTTVDSISAKLLNASASSVNKSTTELEEVKVSAAPPPVAVARPPTPPPAKPEPKRQPKATSTDTITLKRSVGQKYGFALTQDDKAKEVCNHISELDEEGIAEKDGRIILGDRILAVNGKRVVTVDHELILQIIESNPTEVTLLLEHGPSTTIRQESLTGGSAFVAGNSLGLHSKVPLQSSQVSPSPKSKSYETEGLNVSSVELDIPLSDADQALVTALEDYARGDENKKAQILAAQKRLGQKRQSATAVLNQIQPEIDALSKGSLDARGTERLEALKAQKHDALGVVAKTTHDIAYLDDELQILEDHHEIIVQAKNLVAAHNRADAETLMRNRLRTAHQSLDENTAKKQTLFTQLQTKDHVEVNHTLRPADFSGGTVLDFVVARTETGYGFTLDGGHGLRIPASITKVVKYGASDICGLKSGDIILRVNGRDAISGTHKEVFDLIRRSSQPLHLAIFRPNPSYHSTVAAVEDDDTFEDDEEEGLSFTGLSKVGAHADLAPAAGPDLIRVGREILATQNESELEKQKVVVLTEALDDDGIDGGESILIAIRQPLVEPGYLEALLNPIEE